MKRNTMQKLEKILKNYRKEREVVRWTLIQHFKIGPIYIRTYEYADGRTRLAVETPQGDILFQERVE